MATDLSPASPGGVQQLLMDLLSPSRAVAQSRVDALTPDEWQRLWRLASRHRVAPLLGWQLAHAHARLAMPASLTAGIADATREAAVRSLLFQQELALIQRALDGAGIPCRALKGAYLAFHAYPAPALRPLRDLDVVVPRDRAVSAYDALQAAGLRRVEGFMASPEAAMEVHVHLPPLQARCRRFAVELHVRLFHFHAPRDRVGPDLTDDPGFWGRRRQAPVGGMTIDFVTPEDMLLHLAVHAVDGHEFNNGPLVLADVAFLLQRHAIDWPRLWERARRAGHERCCALLLRLVRRYWGVEVVLPAAAPEPDAPTDEDLDAIAALMLCEPDEHLDTLLLGDFFERRGPLAKARYLLGRAFAPAAQLRAEHGLSPGDWRVFLYYPVRWHRQLTHQVPKLWRARRREAALPPPVQRLMAVRRWLESSR